MKVGVLTGGGDCPGLNAIIRAVVLAATKDGIEFVGIKNSFNGLFARPLDTMELNTNSVKDILHRGGTILGTTNSGNPFSYGCKPQKTDAKSTLKLAKEGFHQLKLDAIIAIGGDGTQTMAHHLVKEGVPIIGVPKTIDNDLMASELTVGFQTAVEIATDAISRLHSTAESHQRIMVLEVMGRDSGYIALHAGLAGGADIILIPEIPFDLEKITQKIQAQLNAKKYFALAVVAEGATPKGGTEQTFQKTASGGEILGGIANQVGAVLHKKTGLDARVTTLGHIQRGGPPNFADCILANQFGVEAIKMLRKKMFGRIVTMKNNKLSHVDYETVVNKRRPVDLNSSVIETAEEIGINLGR